MYSRHISPYGRLHHHTNHHRWFESLNSCGVLNSRLFHCLAESKAEAICASGQSQAADGHQSNEECGIISCSVHSLSLSHHRLCHIWRGEPPFWQRLVHVLRCIWSIHLKGNQPIYLCSEGQAILVGFETVL